MNKKEFIQQFCIHNLYNNNILSYCDCIRRAEIMYDQIEEKYPKNVPRGTSTFDMPEDLDTLLQYQEPRLPRNK